MRLPGNPLIPFIHTYYGTSTMLNVVAKCSQLLYARLTAESGTIPKFEVTTLCTVSLK
jgi:hypothetical protein